MHTDDIKVKFTEVIDESENVRAPTLASNTIMHVEGIMQEAAFKLDTTEGWKQVLYILDLFSLSYLRSE